MGRMGALIDHLDEAVKGVSAIPNLCRMWFKLFQWFDPFGLGARRHSLFVAGYPVKER